MPLLGALLGHCWVPLLGCHGRVPLLGASMVGYQRLVYLFTYVLQCNISSYVTFWLK